MSFAALASKFTTARTVVKKTIVAAKQAQTVQKAQENIVRNMQENRRKLTEKGLDAVCDNPCWTKNKHKEITVGVKHGNRYIADEDGQVFVEGLTLEQAIEVIEELEKMVTQGKFDAGIEKSIEKNKTLGYARAQKRLGH